MIHQRTHSEYVEGCFSCKISTVSFGTVPGAHKDQRNQVSRLNRRERELNRYREKRRAGEQPDGTTFEAMEETEKRAATYEKHEQRIKDTHPPAEAKKIKKAMTNVAT